MGLDELRREFEGWKSKQPGIIDKTDLNYIGKFVFDKLTAAQNVLNDAYSKDNIEKVKQRMQEGRDLINSIQALIDEHSQDFTHEKRKWELGRIRAEKNKLQNEIWDIKASIMNKAVDAVPISKWASGFSKVGFTLITSSLTALGLTYASAVDSKNISNITLSVIATLFILGITFFIVGTFYVVKDEIRKKREFNEFLRYLKKRIGMDEIVY